MSLNKAQSAAFIFSQAVACQVKMESMKALNENRLLKGQSQAYGEKDFNDLLFDYGIGRDDVLKYFHTIEGA